MIIALGFWSIVIGYTLVYTGVEWFTTGKGSLAENLGLSSNLLTTPQSPTGSASTTSASSLATYASQQQALGASLGASPSSSSQQAPTTT